MNNKFFTGELDLFTGEDIRHAEETIDIKCSWDLFTFPSFLDKSDKDYEYQGEVYMDLSGAKKHTVAYCLVNTPANMITDKKYYMKKDFGIIDIETPEYTEACIELEKSSIYDMESFEKEYPWFEHHIPKSEWVYDIPQEERLYEVVHEKNPILLASMQQRITDCRAWMKANLKF